MLVKASAQPEHATSTSECTVDSAIMCKEWMDLKSQERTDSQEKLVSMPLSILFQILSEICGESKTLWEHLLQMSDVSFFTFAEVWR